MRYAVNLAVNRPSVTYIFSFCLHVKNKTDGGCEIPKPRGGVERRTSPNGCKTETVLIGHNRVQIFISRLNREPTICQFVKVRLL